MQQLSGIGASAGIATGPMLIVRREAVVVPAMDDPAAAFTETVTKVVDDLRRLSSEASAAGRGEAADVLSAQALMAEDPMLEEGVLDALEAGTGLQPAIETVAGDLAAMLAAMDDEYLAARSADVTEVADRILARLAGIESAGPAASSEPSIVVASTLTAAETAQLDTAQVLGFVVEHGGATSHVAVIARSLGMPAVVGVDGLMGSLSDATVIAIDGETGEVVIDPDHLIKEAFLSRAENLTARRQAAMAFRGVTVTYGDEPFTVAANIGGPDDLERAREVEADGVGLFRTEFLFLDRNDPPSEEEQTEIYTRAVSAFSHPVVIRTFDIGGDKPAGYLETPHEENPFLGERGVRIYSQFDELFRSQIRAMMRASVAGDLWIMIPMIATVEDLVTARMTIDQVRTEMSENGVSVGAPRIGAMIEVPSSALTATSLAKHADFFSIGTNDLTQYTMAADRTNGRLASYADAAHPAVLELCRLTAAAGRSAGVPVSVCGEAAADPILATLYAAMGMSKLSVASPSVDSIKATINGLRPAETSDLLAEAVAAEDAAAVRAIVGSRIDQSS